MRKKILPLFFLLLLLLPTSNALASPLASLSQNEATLDFPNAITFRATLQSDQPITNVTLEYGTQQLTCGQVIAKAFPQFTPAKTIKVEWTWDMRQSGSLPPGASIWWRWRYSNSAGSETISEEQTITWLDTNHNWQTLSEGKIRLHWYNQSESFARDLLTTAQKGLERNAAQAGLAPDAPIDLYIYASTDDMRQAVLYEPSWTGGMAFPEHNIVIIGISPADLDWGRNAIVHELTHVLVGHLTFSCLGDVPTWLNEGLAVFSEGDLDPYSQNQFDKAIQSNTLLSVRSLSGGFSEIADKANLSYSQSYSLVKFLIETYGQEKMTQLLIALRNGATVDEALRQTYGFDVDGLEDAWRTAIHAAPRAATPQPTIQPTPTWVPTIVPISGAPLAVTPTPYTIPTSSSQNPIPTPAPSGPPITLTLLLLAVCCVMGLLFGVIALGIFLNLQRNKEGHHE
jgi:hypothetical protein